MKKTIKHFKSFLVSNSINIGLLSLKSGVYNYCLPSAQLKSLISRKTATNSLLFNVFTYKCVAHQESLLMSFLICTISKKKNTWPQHVFLSFPAHSRWWTKPKNDSFIVKKKIGYRFGPRQDDARGPRGSVGLPNGSGRKRKRGCRKR